MQTDGDDATVGLILTRRQIITLGAAGLATLGGSIADAYAPGVPLDDVDLVATPELTEGPFFVDKMLERSDLVGETKRESVTSGVPLALAVTVLRVQNKRGVPLAGAHVDLWHADSAGVYSNEPSNPMQREDTSRESWLRGYQVTDRAGKVEFATIFPGWYMGRTSHIHFKIRTYDKSGGVTREFTSQFFFDEKVNDAILARKPYAAIGTRATRNRQDGIYNARQADGTAVGSNLTLRTKEKGKGYASEFTVALVLD